MNNDFFTLPDSFDEKVALFVPLLLRYNQTHNISGAKTVETVMDYVEDSIYPLRYLHVSTFSCAIDVGSGAGFPGLLLALALPDVSFTLFEPIAKKSAFLHLSKAELGLKNVHIMTQRVEKVSPWDVDLICSRAVSNTKMLITLTKGFITPKTTLLFYKGGDVEKEITGLKGCELYQRDKRYYLIMKDVHDS